MWLIRGFILWCYIKLVVTDGVPPSTAASKCNSRLVHCVCVNKTDHGVVSFKSARCVSNLATCQQLDTEVTKCYRAKPPSKGHNSYLEMRAEVETGKSKCLPYFDKNAPFGSPKVVLVNTPRVRNAVVDDRVEIECQVTSNPEAHLYWISDNGQVITSSGRFLVSNRNCNPTLTISYLLASDSGNYSCVANNSVGSSRQTVKIIVKVRPYDNPSVRYVGIDGDRYAAYLGSTINLTCTIDFGAPGGLVRFRRVGQLVDDGGRYWNFLGLQEKSLFTQKLRISNVTREDQGKWDCYGRSSKSFSVNKSFILNTAPCPAGYFCPWWTDEKIPCPYGTFSVGGQNETYHCTNCTSGTPQHDSLASHEPARSEDECPRASLRNRPLWLVAVALGILIGVSVTVFLWYRRRCKRSAFPYQQSSEDDDEFSSLYDVFICYSSKDIKFAKELQERLENAGFKCCIDLRDFMPGEAIVVNIANAIYHSRKTLAILSPDFIESEYCKHELHQALNRSIRAHQVVAILYRECNVPLELRHKTYLDYLNCYVKPHFWEQLNKCLSERQLKPMALAT